MRTEMEIQNENVSILLNLIKENPDLRILSMVDYEVVASDEFASWAGSFGESKVDYVWNDGERIYFKSNDEEQLIENEIDDIENETQLFHESHPMWRTIEDRAKERVNRYQWEKVIVVWIGLP